MRSGQRGSAAAFVIAALAIAGASGFGIYRVSKPYFRERAAAQAAAAADEGDPLRDTPSYRSPAALMPPEPTVAVPEAEPPVAPVDRVPDPPSVPSEPTIDGELTVAQIDRVVTSRRSSLDRCYTDQQSSNPDVGRGRIDVSFTIDASGDAIGIRATGFDRALSVCVAGVIRRTKFPMATGESKIELPLDFPAE